MKKLARRMNSQTRPWVAYHERKAFYITFAFVPYFAKANISHPRAAPSSHFFIFHHPSFIIHHSLFIIHYSLFIFH